MEVEKCIKERESILLSARAQVTFADKCKFSCDYSMLRI
jgi:hypothetical protein